MPPNEGQAVIALLNSAIGPLAGGIWDGEMGAKEITYPSAILFDISGPPLGSNLDGNLNGIFDIRMQLDIYAKTRAEVRSLRDMVYDNLPSAKRTVTVDGQPFTFLSIGQFQNNGIVKDYELRVWRSITDFFISYRRS
jgi:hypothetical protein